MTSKHTPGPWMAAARPSSIVGWPVVAPNAIGRSICNITTGHDEAAGNARLIAAAPDLFEALKGAIGALEFSRDYHADLGNEEQALCQDRLDAARTALAKARGEVAP